MGKLDLTDYKQVKEEIKNMKERYKEQEKEEKAMEDFLRLECIRLKIKKGVLKARTSSGYDIFMECGELSDDEFKKIDYNDHMINEMIKRDFRLGSKARRTSRARRSKARRTKR
jgi:hypothetical protein